jgi:hypothetical protein
MGFFGKSLGEILGGISRDANREDYPFSGVTGADGTTTAPGPQCSIALFKLTGTFSVGPPYPNTPGNNWWYCPATKVEYYPAGASIPNNWATPSDEGDSATTPDQECVWAPNAMFQNSSIASSGDFVWCWFDDSALVWVIIGQAPPRVQGYADGGGGSIPADPNDWTAVGAAVFTAPIGGTYLVAYTVGVGSFNASIGNFVSPFLSNIAVNGGGGTDTILQGHFHNPQSLQIPIGAIDGTNPTAAVTLTTETASYNYNTGSLTWIGILTLAKNDVISILVQSPNCAAQVINGVICAVLLHT